MHEKIIWNEAEKFPYADGNPYYSPNAVLKGVFARSTGEWEGFAANIDTLYDAGDNVIATGRYAGKNNRTGKEMNPQAVHVWTLKEGEITHSLQSIDTLNVSQAMS